MDISSWADSFRKLVFIGELYLRFVTFGIKTTTILNIRSDTTPQIYNQISCNFVAKSRGQFMGIILHH